MNYKKLGNTDLDVSTICLGTMTWGEQNTQAEAFEQMDYALDQGVNFWIQQNFMLCHQEKKLMVIQKS
jgi:aryl-alcohol dehydrogenase-like predicted oxidoreductase